MERGSSQSQTSSSVTSKVGPVDIASHNDAIAIANMRRWWMGGSSNTIGRFNSDNKSYVLRFYTDNVLRLVISPTIVLVIRLYFIGFVTALHVFGKLSHYRSGPSA